MQCRDPAAADVTFRKSGPPSTRRRIPGVPAALLTMAVLATVDAAAGPGLVLAGLLAVGPCLAAISARPRAVISVGALALALISVLSWWPDGLFGTVQYLLFVLATLAVTGISTVIVRRRGRLESLAAHALVRLRAIAAIVENSDDAIIGCALDGTMTAWNNGAERVYGYTAEEAIGFHVSMIARPAEADGPDDSLSQIEAGMTVAHYETQRIRKDGGVVDVSVSVSPIRDEAGKTVGASAVARDITARKSAEARQRTVDERTELAQRLQSLGQLAGGVAHDFNNLLAIILNFTAFVEDQVADNSAVRDDLGKIRTAAERAAELTHQLLLFTRGEATHPELLDANAAIAEAKAMLVRTLGEDIHLRSVPWPTPLLIWADPGQMQQVVINLALNARDAMPDGGTLVIEACATDLDGNRSDLRPAPTPGRYLQLTVSDTGSGMPKGIVDHIFEPFFSTKPKGEGTGLGLATVYGIITEAGGSVHVYSELNIGTTIRAYFPLAAEGSVLNSDENADGHPPHGNGQTILLVEDEEAIRQLVARILEGNGYDVLSAHDGPTALTIEVDHSCHLLLTDVIMPTMSGGRLAELMQQRRPGLPVLYMSGYSDGLFGSSDLRSENISFIAKPFNARDLLAKVHEMLVSAANEVSTSRRG
jgi:two-component system cell cycle sensor histidine kinase/response regulator CckA